MTMRYLVMITVYLCAVLELNSNAHAEWTRLGEDDQGMVLYIDHTTLRQKEDGARLWTLLDFANTKIIADTPFKSGKTLHQYDCLGERARILSMSFHSGNMGLGKTVHFDSTPQAWEPVSPSSIGSEAFDYACSLFSTDGAKHRYSQDEIPGWKQGPSSKQADSFYDPLTIKRNGDKVKMWVITNFKEPIQIQGKLHWSSKSRIEYDCQTLSIRITETYLYDLPYAKGKAIGKKPSIKDWYQVAEKSPERGLLNIACDR